MSPDLHIPSGPDRFSDALEWRSLSDNEREREYSPSSCIGGDLGPYLAEYAASSQAAREHCAHQGLEIQTISYGRSATQTIDLVVPADRPAPLVVFIHGGYWQELSKRESFSPAPGFVSHGVAYAAIDYTLAPTAGVGEIVDECRSAVAHLRFDADALGVDPERIVIAGSSAGAHLTAMVSLDTATTWRPAGMALISGVYELEPLIGTSINGALDLDSAAARRLSPARMDLCNPPPAVVTWGENETAQFKMQSALFAQQLRNTGGHTAELEIPDRNHFDVLTDFGDPTSALGQAILGLVQPT